MCRLLLETGGSKRLLEGSRCQEVLAVWRDRARSRKAEVGTSGGRPDGQLSGVNGNANNRPSADIRACGSSGSNIPTSGRSQTAGADSGRFRLAATSRPCRRARKSCNGATWNGRFPARNLNFTSARHGRGRVKTRAGIHQCAARAAIGPRFSILLVCASRMARSAVSRHPCGEDVTAAGSGA